MNKDELEEETRDLNFEELLHLRITCYEMDLDYKNLSQEEKEITRIKLKEAKQIYTMYLMGEK